MFECHITVPKSTLYKEMGVSPDSPVPDIERGKARAKRMAFDERKNLQGQLDEIYKSVPGLEVAQEKVDALQAKDQLSEGELREARVALYHLEQKALLLRHDFRRLRAKIEALSKRDEELNGLAILNREHRQEYDKAHPPLALLKLEDCSQIEFLRPKAATRLLRRELNRFFAAMGEQPFYPSDLLRDDFTADFTHNPLIDD